MNLLSSNAIRWPAALVTIDDAVQYAGWAANEFARGRMDEKKLAAVDKLLDRFAQLLKQRDQEAKVAELQATLAALKAKTP